VAAYLFIAVKYFWDMFDSKPPTDLVL